MVHSLDPGAVSTHRQLDPKAATEILDQFVHFGAKVLTEARVVGKVVRRVVGIVRALGADHQPPLDPPPGAILLQHVGEFMGQQVAARRSARARRLAPQIDVAPQGEGLGRDASGRRRRGAVVVQAHLRQIVPEARLEEGPLGRRQGPAGTGSAQVRVQAR
jgi:hypothetical protein